MTTKDTLSVVAAASLVVIVGGVWLIHRRFAGRIAAGNRFDIPPRPDPVGSSKGAASHEPQKPALSRVPETPPRPEPALHIEQLEVVAMRVADSDLREFMWDITYRAREDGPDFGEATSLEFIEELVDRVDDLQAILKNHQGQTANDIQEFHQILERVLAHCGVELIHSDQWAPSIQRAIAKEPTSGVETPTILRFGTTGIRRFGQLLRKQEVVLAVPL